MYIKNNIKNKYVDKNYIVFIYTTVTKIFFVLLKHFFKNYFFNTVTLIRDFFHRDQVILFKKLICLNFNLINFKKGKIMKYEKDNKLFIYKINTQNFFEVSSSHELVKRLEKLTIRIRYAHKYIIGFDTCVYPGYATLLGVNPLLINFEFIEATNIEVSENSPSSTKGNI